jgi:hypothetical protein
MTGSDIDILKRLRFGSLPQGELLEIFFQHRGKYRIVCELIQHPNFPEAQALNVLAELFSMDLIRVIKNRRTNPFVRKKAEIEFGVRYQKIPSGEKISYLRIAPLQVLNQLLRERDSRLLQVIFENPECTEDLVLQFINRRADKPPVYEALLVTQWPNRPRVADAVIRDPHAPIRVLLDIIPLLNHNQLKQLYEDENTHQRVKESILEDWKKRQP